MADVLDRFLRWILPEAVTGAIGKSPRMRSFPHAHQAEPPGEPDLRPRRKEDEPGGAADLRYAERIAA
jgi:hypothetical protein